MESTSQAFMPEHTGLDISNGFESPPLPSPGSNYGEEQKRRTLEGLRDGSIGSRVLDSELPNTPPQEAWMLKARCRTGDTDIFFPSDGVGVDRARTFCGQCAVASECLEYALTYRIDHGVWGGASERERRKINRQRRISAT